MPFCLSIKLNAISTNYKNWPSVQLRYRGKSTNICKFYFYILVMMIVWIIEVY